MSTLDVVDETFVVASPAHIAALLGERRSWRRWWPDLTAQVVEQRHAAGIRWRVSGALSGTMEVWLEPVLDGTVLHFYLHADGPAGPRPPARNRAAREAHRRRLQAKALAFELKARTEDGRAPGHPPRRGPDGSR